MINVREWALPVYTIMMQMAAGSMFVLWIVYTYVARRYGQATADKLSQHLVMIVFITVLTATVGSHYHLSRPIVSLRALHNFHTSWLSREVAFTIAFAVLVGVLFVLQRCKLGTLRLRLITGWSATVMGLATVYAMSHVYMLPTQVAWNSVTTPLSFFSSALLLGSIAISALLLMNFQLVVLQAETDIGQAKYTLIIQQVLLLAGALAIASALAELLGYVYQIKTLSDGTPSARISLGLLLDLYRVLFVIRLGLLILGVGVLMTLILWQRMAKKRLLRLLTPTYIIFLGVLVSEVLGRFLFYAIHVRIGI